MTDTFNTLGLAVPAETLPDPEGIIVETDADRNLRYLAAQQLIESIKEELQVHPGFTRALAERYFSSLDGIPSDMERNTVFTDGAYDCWVGYQYRYIAPAGFHEMLAATKKSPTYEERVSLEAKSYLYEPTDGRFTYDGSLMFQRTSNGGDTETLTIATADEAHALIARLMGAAATGGFRLFGGGLR